MNGICLAAIAVSCVVISVRAVTRVTVSAAQTWNSNGPGFYRLLEMKNKPSERFCRMTASL
jgi:hypothetical protein